MPQAMGGAQPPNYMAYDRTITVFSPDGRLLQVEYARQMVKNGITSVGVRTDNAIMLATVKPLMNLAVSETYKKIQEVDSHIAFVSAGSLADARNLVEMARVKSQVNKITYGEPISVSSLTTYVCNRMHLVTQYAGVRPYGVGLLIGGADDTGARLYETEPSGTMIEWKAQAIGRGAEKAKKILNKDYKENLSINDAGELLLKALGIAEKNVTLEKIEAVLVKKDNIEKVVLKEGK
jgi:proteasome alpha subunit